MRHPREPSAQAAVPQDMSGRTGMEGASPVPFGPSPPPSRETTPGCEGSTSVFGSLGRVWNTVVQTSRHRLLFSWGTNPNLTAQEANPNKVKVVKSEPANPNNPDLI
ncbi:hypothetical protein BGZ82_007381 [Podila clonocystis]|nr:hypothetical protein BGZ82_007381 [Podila clonocystis]